MQRFYIVAVFAPFSCSTVEEYTTTYISYSTLHIMKSIACFTLALYEDMALS